MTALIVIGIIASILLAIGIVGAINEYSLERYGYRPLTIPAAVLIVVVSLFAIFGVISSDLNQIIWLASSGAVYFGHMIYVMRRTNIFIGFACSLILLLASLILLFIWLSRIVIRQMLPRVLPRVLLPRGWWR